jgi:hypothetical protein
VSHAEREQVIDALKAAFVRGMLAKDKFDLRVSQAFGSRTYAELAAVTADLTAGPTAGQPPRPARAQGGQQVLRPGRVMAAATAFYAGVQAFVFLSPWPAGTENDPARAKIALFLVSNPIYLLVLLICVVCLIAGRRERRSSGRPPRRPAPGVGGRYPGTRSQPARAESFRRPVAVTSTRPELSGAILPGRRGGLMVTAAVAPSRVASRDGWQSPCDEPRITRPETRSTSLMTGPIDLPPVAAGRR